MRDNVLEDVNLARVLKRHGFKLRLALGNGLVSCRMYDSWPTIRDGFAKNLMAGYGNSPVALLGATLFHWGVFVWPWVAGVLGAGWVGVIIGLWRIMLRLGTALMGRTPALDAISLPLAVPVMTRIAWQSYYWSITGQSNWKGRQLQKLP